MWLGPQTGSTKPWGHRCLHVQDVVKRYRPVNLITRMKGSLWSVLQWHHEEDHINLYRCDFVPMLFSFLTIFLFLIQINLDCANQWFPKSGKWEILLEVDLSLKMQQPWGGWKQLCYGKKVLKQNRKHEWVWQHEFDAHLKTFASVLAIPLTSLESCFPNRIFTCKENKF